LNEEAQILTLEDVKSGQAVRVVRVGGDGPIRRRLLDMGIRAGEIIKMVKSAPLKDPLEISLNNGHMSIRRSEAALISVEILPED
jgi:Fe2+ transport system protein FeoA